MSSSFFLSNTSSGGKIKASGIKRKYEGQSRGKPKTPKKFSAGGKKKAQDKNKFSKGNLLQKYHLKTIILNVIKYPFLTTTLFTISIRPSHRDSILSLLDRESNYIAYAYPI